MYVSGFALPVVGVVAAVAVAAMSAATVAALVAVLPLPESLTRVVLAFCILAAGLLLVWLVRRLRLRFWAPLVLLRASDAAWAGDKAALLGAVGARVPVPSGLVLGPISLALIRHEAGRNWLSRRLARALRSWRTVIVRASSPVEDATDGSGAGVLTSRFAVAAPDALQRALSDASAGWAGRPGVLLLQPSLAGTPLWVSGFDPSSGRTDLVRIEGAGMRLVERAVFEERPEWRRLAEALRIAEQQFSGRIVLEFAGSSPVLVQVRRLAAEARETWSRVAWIRVAPMPLPEALADDVASLRIALRRWVGSDLGLILRAGIPYFSVSEQRRMLVRRGPGMPLMRLLWRRLPTSGNGSLGLADRWALAFALRLRVHLWYRELCALGSVGAVRAQMKLQPLSLDAEAGAFPSFPTCPEAPDAPASLPAGLLPWRRVLATLLGRALRRDIERYLGFRSGLPAAVLVSGTPDAWLGHTEAEAVPMYSGPELLQPGTLVPGRARGPLWIPEPGLQCPPDGAVVWMPDSADRFPGFPGRVAAFLVARGSALDHLGLQAAARGIPLVTGVAKPAWPLGTQVRVVARAEGVEVGCD